MAEKYEELYQELIRRCKEIAVLGSCGGLLGWDERTYMPRAGCFGPRRADVLPGRVDPQDVHRSQNRRNPLRTGKIASGER